MLVLESARAIGMPSPFPGMDPYLEAPAGWQEFHHRFISGISDVLVPLVRPRYAVRIERYVYLQEVPDDVVRILRPDIAIIEEESSPFVPTSTQTATITAIPLTLPFIDEVRHFSIEIREMGTQRVVTVIEMLSPFNKRAGEGRDEYIDRRNTILRSGAHLIELDLLRAGERVPMAKPLPLGDYHVIVSRVRRRPIADVYSWTIRRPLPTVPVPLSGDDPDVLLNLQEILNIVYDRAGYDYTLPYDREPDPPLNPEDAEWAREILSRHHSEVR